VKPKKKLQREINDFAKRYNTYTFEPHVTLVGLMYKPKNEVVTRGGEIAKKLKPYTIKLQDLFYIDAYYGCLMIKAKPTPMVMQANKIAQELFVLEEDYTPHLSLIYGNLEANEKKKIISEVGTKLQLEFIVDKLSVYYTGGYVKDWHMIEEYNFSK